MIETYTDWSAEDLWQHQQANFSAHLAMMYAYLSDHDLSPDDFIQYVGERAAPGWRDCRDPHDMLNGILLNVQANGGSVHRASFNGDHAEATVAAPVRLEVMRFYGVPQDLAERTWEKYRPIAEALGLAFSWESAGKDIYRIAISRA
ncbi:MAG TPA: hypothetical protein VFB58_00420 [Chloroflexota bacterium]|nr:hypothetical protein [Chloroflexota bacterium]